MSQKRLNSVAECHCHLDLLDAVDLVLIKDSVCRRQNEYVWQKLMNTTPICQRLYVHYRKQIIFFQRENRIRH